MTLERHPLKDLMLERLMVASGWLSGPELAEGLSLCQMAIDDALADLVIEEKADYRPKVGYRLKGTVLCRQALRLLKANGGASAIKGHPFDGVYRVGVAEHRDGVGLVMYELEMPMPPKGPDSLPLHLRQVEAVLKFAARGELT